ncbi:MAG TPA: arginine deiminase-related protein [Steroidobacteraceae bacterium]|nr:arginine deiminase-related protein [Steroidobacteraceae bacterium]
MSPAGSQVSGAILMVRPKNFGFNAETAATNRFQHEGGAAGVAARARAEFDAFAAALAGEGVTVCVAEDADPPRPDAVFPNNWVSFHADGTVVLYPMQAVSRRAERRAGIVEQVARDTGFVVRRTLDLTNHEKEGRFLEGTGSLVLDHVSRIAYACRSPRTDEAVAHQWAGELGYALELFDARDAGGAPIYHTNVVMHVGTRSAVVALDNVAAADRERVAGRLASTGHDVVAITEAEMNAFAGNMLEVGSWEEFLGDFRILVMSRTARRALAPEKFERLSAGVDQVLAPPVETIERHGGGSVRCMLAEVFLR